MTSHPNRSQNFEPIHYWTGDKMVRHNAVIVRSGAGHGPGPEYAIIYRLDDGRFLGGVRHQDRGDLMTEVSYGKSTRSVTPRRWR